MTPENTMIRDTCHHNATFPSHHNAPWTLSSQHSMNIFRPVLLETCHHNDPCPCHPNAPWPLYSQCSVTLVITVIHDTCHHNAPCLFSKMLHDLVITMLYTLVITKLHFHCHHNPPWALGSQCFMPLSSQCSMLLDIKMIHDLYHHNAPNPCNHNVP